MGRKIGFTRPDGKPGAGWADEPPAGKSVPAVVVIQEWWGLNDQIRGVAQELAAAGFRALVPDLYHGKVALDEAEAGHLMAGLDFLDAAKQDIRGAVQHVKQGGGKAGVIGFCMGGALAILSAIHVPEVDAAVSWYGVPPPEAGDPGTIRAPLQGHFGRRDAFFPIAQVEALEARLQKAGIAHEFHRYDCAHAFGNETGKNHDAQAKQLAWQRTLDFLRRHLRG